MLRCVELWLEQRLHSIEVLDRPWQGCGSHWMVVRLKMRQQQQKKKTLLAGLPRLECHV